MEVQDNDVKIVYIVKYTSYTPSQKQSIYKYRQEHPEKMREYARRYQANKYQNDPEYRHIKNEQSKARYHAKKAAARAAAAVQPQATVPDPDAGEE